MSAECGWGWRDDGERRSAGGEWRIEQTQREVMLIA